MENQTNELIIVLCIIIMYAYDCLFGCVAQWHACVCDRIWKSWSSLHSIDDAAAGAAAAAQAHQFLIEYDVIRSDAIALAPVFIEAIACRAR
jgi:hypothetical protein